MTRRRIGMSIGVGAGLVVVLAVWLSGVRALSVESGSMGTAVPVGSLAISRPVPAAAVTPGDVVSVVGPDAQRLTHRVVSAERTADGSSTVSLVLKGDANSVPDAEPIVVQSVSVVVATIPHAGVVADAMTSAPALVVLGSTALVLLLRRRWRVSGLAVVMGTTLALVSTGATGAVFTDTAAVDGGALTSGAVNTPNLPTASQAATTGTVNIGFTSTTVGTQGASPSGYEVYRYSSASGGTGTLVCTTTSSFSCTEARTALATGTYHYAVRATFATSWLAESSRRPYAHDATAPTVAVTRPLPGDAGGSKQLRDSVTSGCPSGGVACGTAVDVGGGTVADVEYSLRGTQVSGGVTTYACWNGSAWVVSSTGACTFAAATGTGAWLVPGSVATAYPNPAKNVTHSFMLVVRATDGFGNQSTSTTVNFHP